MKRTASNIGLLGLGIILLVVFGGEQAQAWGGKKKKEREAEAPRAVNLDRHPDYHIFRGELRQDHLGNWSLGKYPLSFNRNSKITGDTGGEGPGALEEGRSALVTAANIGGNLIVRRITMVPINEMLERGFYGTGTTEEEPPALDVGTPR